MWVARDRDGMLALFDDEPIKILDSFFIPRTPEDRHEFLDEKKYPDLTFDNSPIEIEEKKKKFI